MSDSPLILPLAGAEALSLCGGKAINLSRLIHAGLPVPEGFVITTAAFRTAAGSTEIPPKIAAQIRQAYAEMGSPMVAARSSATAEDLQHGETEGGRLSRARLRDAEEVAPLEKRRNGARLDRRRPRVAVGGEGAAERFGERELGEGRDRDGLVLGMSSSGSASGASTGGRPPWAPERGALWPPERP